MKIDSFNILCVAAILNGCFLLGICLYKVGMCALTIGLAVFLVVLFILFVINLK